MRHFLSSIRFFVLSAFNCAFSYTTSDCDKTIICLETIQVAHVFHAGGIAGILEEPALTMPSPEPFVFGYRTKEEALVAVNTGCSAEIVNNKWLSSGAPTAIINTVVGGEPMDVAHHGHYGNSAKSHTVCSYYGPC